MKTELERRLQDPEFARLFRQEGLVIDVLEKISEWMADRNVTQSELAKRLGVSRSAVSQLLNGRDVSGRDMKLRTIADVAHALGAEPVFRLREERSGAVKPPAEVGNVIKLRSWGVPERFRVSVENATSESLDDTAVESMA